MLARETITLAEARPIGLNATRLRQFYDRRHGAGGRMREIAPVLMKAGLVGEDGMIQVDTALEALQKLTDERASHGEVTADEINGHTLDALKQLIPKMADAGVLWRRGDRPDGELQMQLRFGE